MLKFILCEDNQEELEKTANIIRKLLVKYDFEYRINSFNKYSSELQKIIDNELDQKIYILDIELSTVSGLEIASKIRENDSDSIIIFVTAHVECKNDIFYSRLLAIDYIVKQKTYEQRLEETLKESLKLLNKKRILNFVFNHTTYRLSYNEILYIEKVPMRSKCSIATENGDKFYISDSLVNLEKQMSPVFYRSHQSCIVNVTKIKKIDCVDNVITFKNGEVTVLLSNRHKKGFKEYVRDYN